MVFALDNTYGVSVTRQTARNAGFGAWTALGGFVEIGPTAVVDAAGLVRVLAVGGDVRLYECRRGRRFRGVAGILSADPGRTRCFGFGHGAGGWATGEPLGFKVFRIQRKSRDDYCPHWSLIDLDHGDRCSAST